MVGKSSVLLLNVESCLIRTKPRSVQVLDHMDMTDEIDHRICYPSGILTLDVDVQGFHRGGQG